MWILFLNYCHIEKHILFCRFAIVSLFICSSLLYLKFVMLWATVVMADYMLEFRFEFLWPFWMMLRSVYDSFKYQGLVSLVCLKFHLNIIVEFIIHSLLQASLKSEIDENWNMFITNRGIICFNIIEKQCNLITECK